MSSAFLGANSEGIRWGSMALQDTLARGSEHGIWGWDNMGPDCGKYAGGMWI